MAASFLRRGIVPVQARILSIIFEFRWHPGLRSDVTVVKVLKLLVFHSNFAPQQKL